jgi:TonB family protein
MRVYSRPLRLIASVTLTSALAQVDENGQPTQYPLRGTCPLQCRIWVRETQVHMLENARHYLDDRDRKNMHHLAGGERPVSIIFVINRAGHIVSAKVEKSSGDAVLDKAALLMVRQADPVPLPPPSLTDENLDLRVSIQFNRAPSTSTRRPE